MAADLSLHRDALLALSRRHENPYVVHRAHMLFLVIVLGSLARVHAETGCGEKNLAKWRDRYLQEGVTGLMDRPRRGRPLVVTPEGDRVLVEALARSPFDYGYPVALWGLVDLRHLLNRELGIVIGDDGLSRHLKKLGYVYRRPKHDLHHRQDLDAVESCRFTLQQLLKGGALTMDPACSFWMNRISTPTQDWRRCGSGVG
jgi:transposase